MLHTRAPAGESIIQMLEIGAHQVLKHYQLISWEFVFIFPTSHRHEFPLFQLFFECSQRGLDRANSGLLNPRVIQITIKKNRQPVKSISGFANQIFVFDFEVVRPQSRTKLSTFADNPLPVKPCSQQTLFPLPWKRTAPTALI